MPVINPEFYKTVPTEAVMDTRELVFTYCEITRSCVRYVTAG